MKYMILIYSDPAREPKFGTPEFDSMMADYFKANDQMVSDGVIRGGDGLQGIETATSLRINNDKVETMDGPFAETREYLGGYYMVEVPDLDKALEYAALIPTAKFGTVEVRPVMDYNPAGN